MRERWAICTPTSSHAAVARAALTAGKHAVVEKPLAVTVADAEELAALAAERGLILSVMAQRRFEPEGRRHRQALELVRPE